MKMVAKMVSEAESQKLIMMPMMGMQPRAWSRTAKEGEIL
jgi:hypothetical protein